MAAGFSEGSFSDKPGLNEWETPGGFGAGGDKDSGSKKGKSKKANRKSSDSAASRSRSSATEGENAEASDAKQERRNRAVAIGDWLVSHDTEKKQGWTPKENRKEDKKSEPKPDEQTEVAEPATKQDERKEHTDDSAIPAEAASGQESESPGEQEAEHDGDEKRYDKEDWPAQGFVLPLDAVGGGESIDFVLNLHEAEPPHPEAEEHSAQVKKAEETSDLVVVAQNERGAELPGLVTPAQTMENAGGAPEEHEQQAQYPHEYVAPVAMPVVPEATFPAVAAPENDPASPDDVPEDLPVIEASEPAAPREELADDIPELPVLAQYTNPVGGWNPAMAYRRYTERDTAAREGHSVDEQLVTKRELDDAVYYAAKAGQNRGVVAGMFVGGLYEHFKHKRREKKTAKLIKQQNKQIEQMREDQHFYFTEQTSRESENQRQLQAAEQRSAATEQQLREQRISERQTTERLVAVQESAAKQQAEAAQKHELPKDGVSEEQRLEIPREHVLQNSAWHSIEVDKRTGRPVENPTFMYGREYYRERAQEVGPVVRRNAAAGEVALVAASQAGSDNTATNTQSTSLPPTTSVPSATTQGPPSSRQRAKATANNLRNQLTSSTAGGPLWPYLVALVVILFCLVVLLH